MLFQFSLWDSLISLGKEINKIANFQFSLWDSNTYSKNYKKNNILLSILFMRFYLEKEEKEGKELDELSILFMRFLYQLEIVTINALQLSILFMRFLCYIRHLPTLNILLSILFMRFIQPSCLDSFARILKLSILFMRFTSRKNTCIFVRFAFNSLYEIL